MKKPGSGIVFFLLLLLLLLSLLVWGRPRTKVLAAHL